MRSIDNLHQTAQEPLCRQIVAAHEQDTTGNGTEPQNGPEGTMESLAGLRVYVGRHARMDEMTKAALLVYAREIEREVKELTDERDLLKTQWEAGVDFDQRLESCAENREDVTLWGVDYMPNPLDADGEPIRVGNWIDVGDGKQRVEAVTPDAVYWWEEDGCHWVNAHMVTRHHAQTVEDVLREFADEVWNRYCNGTTASDSGIRELEAEYAAKLRELVEDMAAEIRGLGVDFKRVGWCDYADRMRELGIEVDA